MGACFSLGWLENLLIWIVVIVVLVAIVRVFVPWLMNSIGAPPGGGSVVTILGYIVWGIVAIFAIIFVFDLLSCLVSGSPSTFRFPR